MNYVSPERQRIAKLNELGATVDSFMAANGIKPPAYPAQFIHDHPRPIEVMGAPPPNHPAALSYLDDGYTGGVPDDGLGQQSMVNEPPAEPAVHPLAIFVNFDGTVKPPRWVIPGFIPANGVVTIAGAPGVGKTTALLPLAMTAAGLHGDDQLMPVQWRHVVYITEDLEQAQRILAGIVSHSNLNISFELVRERLHIVKAVRLDPAFVASVGMTYRELFTRTVQGIEVLPLVVIDTRSAVLAMENENDNSETSSMLAALKQGFSELPIWLVGHVSKANLGRSDVAELSNRGAGSNDGDGNQTMFLVQEGANRYLVLGKKRIEPRWLELEIVSYTAQTQAFDEFGNPETIVMRWGIAAPPAQSRKEAATQAAEIEAKNGVTQLRQQLMESVQVAWQSGIPINKSGLRGLVRGNNGVLTAAIDSLLSGCWLYEVTVPKDVRTNLNRRTFLVSLSAEERGEFMRSGKVPPEKLAIPPSWKKPDTATAVEHADSVRTVCPSLSPPVPEPTGTNGKDGGVDTPSVCPPQISPRDRRIEGTDGIDSQAANQALPAKHQPTNPDEDF